MSCKQRGAFAHVALLCIACIAECSLWQDKQETAFKAWLNMILLPATADHSDGGRAALASRRLTAKMRGLLWRIYQRDEQFRDVMLRVEQRVMDGQLRMKDEVGRCSRQGQSGQGREGAASLQSSGGRKGSVSAD
jgi:hypothetical protein